MYSERHRRGITEVLEILENNKEYLDKLPLSLVQFFKENASKTYKFSYDKTKELKDIQLLKETKCFLAMLYLYYWSDEGEKTDFLRILKSHSFL